MEEQLNGNPVELLRVLFGVAPGVHDSNVSDSWPHRVCLQWGFRLCYLTE